MNRDFAELYVSHREKLPADILPNLDLFLANCAPNICEPLGLTPDYELPYKRMEIWSAVAPGTVKLRLAGILADTDCLLHHAVSVLGNHVKDPSGRNDPVIDSPREVYEFLQLWIGVHAEALATSRGFVVVGN